MKISKLEIERYLEAYKRDGNKMRTIDEIHFIKVGEEDE